MTIKQQGGIFGRNPTFNDVEVEGTLTGSVSGNVTASSGSSSFQKIGIQNTSPTAPLTIGYSGAEAQIQINNSGDSRMFYAGAFSEDEGIVRLFNSSNVETVRIPAESTAGVHTYFNAGNVGVGTTTPSAKLSVSGGNISVDSGYGIDFSATSGTGTSELFDDYEEGTWTPVIAGGTTAGSNTYTVQNGYYTKIGNRVLINLDIAMSNKDAAMDGTVIITGLPFTPSTATNNAASMAFGRYDNVNLSAGYTQLVAMVQSNGTFLPREVGDNVAAQIIDDAAMSNTSRFQLSGHYFV